MKFLKRFFTGIILLIAIFVAIGYLLPETAHVERSILINATPEKIFPYVNNFREFEKWQPWAKKDSNLEVQYEGPESGVGAKMLWRSDSPEVGSGHNEILTSEAPTRVETRLDFGHGGTTSSYFNIREEAEGSRVTWGFDTELGYNPINRYFGMMLDKWIGADYETGLDNLKSLVEASGG